jgi:anti-sigma-K factor RskA
MAHLGVLVISESGMDGTLVVRPPAEFGGAYQYQLWLIRGGQRTSGGVFSIRDEKDGYGYLVVQAPDSLLSYDSFGVTIEPHGGSPGPTGNKVMGSDL